MENAAISYQHSSLSFHIMRTDWYITTNSTYSPHAVPLSIISVNLTRNKCAGRPSLAMLWQHKVTCLQWRQVACHSEYRVSCCFRLLFLQGGGTLYRTYLPQEMRWHVVIFSFVAKSVLYLAACSMLCLNCITVTSFFFNEDWSLK